MYVLLAALNELQKEMGVCVCVVDKPRVCITEHNEPIHSSELLTSSRQQRVSTGWHRMKQAAGQHMYRLLRLIAHMKFDVQRCTAM